MDHEGKVLGRSTPGRFRVEARHPRPGWVEYDPEQLLTVVRESALSAIRNAHLTSSEIAAIGLSNQGETVIAFDAENGQPIYPAISWQDRRGEEILTQWRAEGLDDGVVSAATGLRLDPYFSAIKFSWILENVPRARALLAIGRLRFGTSDAWILWHLTGGRAFVTDVATASRTMLLSLATCQWDNTLAAACGIPVEGLPEVVSNSAEIGLTDKNFLGVEIPVTGVCVDQQAALFGQRAFATGQAKITFGTGCFILANIGHDATRRAAGLLTSVGWRIQYDTTFVFDGGVFSAGSLMDWLCRIGLAANVKQLAELVASAGDRTDIFFVPALGGLGAPHWSGQTRAGWIGMDHGTNQGHMVRSAFEALTFRVKELVDAMSQSGINLSEIQLDGGLSQCDILMQMQADVLGIPLRRGEFSELTALGVGYLAGLGCGIWKSPAEIPNTLTVGRRFEPTNGLGRACLDKFTRWKQICAAVTELGERGLFAINLIWALHDQGK
jgi:glycerol kinase